jgi:transposase InsO family protein
MESKVEFIREWETKELSFSELCRRPGISRQTGYTIVERFNGEGVEGLRERSRAPHHRPWEMEERMREAVIELRAEHPSWGPKKLRKVLEDEWAGCDLRIPARSTIGELLDREGLIYRRRRREALVGGGQAGPLSDPLECNDVWSADYKGWFRTGDGRRCEPFTVTDNTSRKILRLVAGEGIDGKQARAVLESAFKEYGMPKAMRTDNGTPFASPAPGGLSELAVWWIRLGIAHERIERGKPEQNGRHERMHLSLIQDCLDYRIGQNCQAQGRIFRGYQKEFNQVRPHEALGMKTPDSVWTPSPRRYPSKLPVVEYSGEHTTRRVNEHGSFLWKGRQIALTKVLRGEAIGLLQIDDDVHHVCFGPVCLGLLDEPTRTFVRVEVAEKWARKREAAKC